MDNPRTCLNGLTHVKTPALCRSHAMLGCHCNSKESKNCTSLGSCLHFLTLQFIMHNFGAEQLKYSFGHKNQMLKKNKKTFKIPRVTSRNT